MKVEQIVLRALSEQMHHLVRTARVGALPCLVLASRTSPFRYFKTAPEVIRLAVLMYVKYSLSLRNVEDLLAERGICRRYFAGLADPTIQKLIRAMEKL